MVFYEEKIVMLEVPESSEMVAYKDAHYLAVGHHFFSVPVPFTSVFSFQMKVFLRFFI